MIARLTRSASPTRALHRVYFRNGSYNVGLISTNDAVHLERSTPGLMQPAQIHLEGHSLLSPGIFTAILCSAYCPGVLCLVSLSFAYLVFCSVFRLAFRAEVSPMSDGGSGEQPFLLVRSSVWSSICWLRHAKGVRTVDAGPSPSSHSQDSQRRFLASWTTEAETAWPSRNALAIDGMNSARRLSSPVFAPPGA